MSKRLFGWLGFLSKHRPEPGSQNLNQEDARYPAFSKGIAVEPIEKIMDRQRELIQQIVQSRGLAGLHNRRKAEEQIISPIKHFAEWVHLLPASDNSYFKGEGGLFRFGLESALFSIRHAERSILTRVTPEERREAERIWTHAAFLAGLVSESVLTLSKMNVYSENGDTWHPGVEPLYQWLMRNRVKNYHIRWLAMVDSAMATAIAAKTIQQEQAALLAKGEKSVLPTLMSAIQNPYDGSNQIVAIVRTIRLKLIDKDLAEDPTNYGKPLSGMHLEPWLIDAMRHMIVNRHWLANTETGRIWYGLDGLYLVWPLAAADIKEELRNAKCPFVPKTTEIIAEMMCEAGIIDQNEAVGGYIFTIGIPQASSKLKPLSAIRIKRKEILLLDEAFTPIGIQLLFNGNVADVQDVSIGVSDDDNEVERVVHANTDLVDFGVASENTEYDADYASQYEDGYPVQSNSDDDKDKILAGKSVQSLDTFGGILNGSIVEENVMTIDNGDNMAFLNEQDKAWISNLLGNVSDSNAGDSSAEEWFAQDNTGEVSKHISPPNHEGLLKSRCPMVMKELRKLGSEFVEAASDGNTKINVQGLSKIKMDIKDCLDVLKASGLLVLTDGEALMIETKGSKDIRFFLVKGDIRHGL